MTDAGWTRLGRRIKAERGRKGYPTAAALADAAGLSVRTVEIIEAGSRPWRPRDTTQAKIERALGWQPGSVERIVNGGRPRQAADPLLQRVIAAWPQLSGDDQVQMTELVERLARGQ